MKRIITLVVLATLPVSLLAADVTGTWKADFDTQRGVQKYTFVLKQDGTKVAGKASADNNGQVREADLKDGKIDGDTVTFAEPLSVQGNDITITYTGKLTADGIKFTRQVGDFGSSEATAKLDSAAAPAQVAQAQPAAGENQTAQTNAAPRGRRGGRGGFGGTPTSGPDDKQVYPEPPTGFNVARADIPHGVIRVVLYDSKSLGTHRQVRVYTPPGYTDTKKYPVLYLLHGISADDTYWINRCRAAIIMDNLIADGKVTPPIMVFPNGDSSITSPPRRGGGAGGGGRGGRGGGSYESDSWGRPFENDLLKDIVPLIEASYSISADQSHRALAGLSMGGGQTLNIGLSHSDTFAYVGAFSSAPDTKQFGFMYGTDTPLLTDPAAVKKNLKLMWVAGGNKDGLLTISQNVHNLLKENGVTHVWNVDGHAHEDIEWEDNLYWFAQQIFK